MTKIHIGVLGLLCATLAIPVLHAEDFSRYRGMPFGMTFAAAAKELGTQEGEAKTTHRRPAVIQEMNWQPPADAATADPVKGAVLCFYNGELFRMVVTYDRYRVEGMSADDMIAGISATYGPSTKPGVEIAYHSNFNEVATVLARWENAEYSYNLVRTGDRSSFALVLYSKRLDALAQTAILESVKLEAMEAPQREIEKEKKHAEEARLILEKARSVNKPNFRP